MKRKKMSCDPASRWNQSSASEKKAYVPPSIAVLCIEMEEGIAAGSGVTSPSDSSNNVKDSWNTDTERSGGLDW